VVYKFDKFAPTVGACAATLVSSDWAVTAAHCLVGETQNSMTLILGEHTITTSNDVFDANR
jgi:V8-like Glu-specific endopeptidase